MKIKITLITAFCTLISAVILAQAPVKVYNIKASKDSFTVREAGYTYRKAIKSNADTAAFGTDFFNNVIIVKTDLDSVKITYNPKYEPDEQLNQVNIVTPHFRQVVYYTFHQMRNKFSKAYMAMATGNAQYEIPETYELANILFALTRASDADNNRTFKNSAYFKKVQSYFARYKQHPIFQKIQFGADKQGVLDYYSFRENSFCYEFTGSKIIRNGQYNIVYGETKDNVFQKLLPLIQDFAQKSHFREFYKKNRAYYQSLIADEKKFMPVNKMRAWLEQNFKNRIQSYKVVFSPLILGSHSTQKFYWMDDVKTGFFYESIMFVSSVEVFNQGQKLTNAKKEGLASGIVFTEIDHNYCNPASDSYRKQIDSALSNRKLWIALNGDGDIYDTPESIFNEYITHGVFVLYCYDTFKDAADFDLIRKNRESLMANHRKYIQFRQFDTMLLDLYKNKKPGQFISDLYPGILKWCKEHND